MGTGGQPRPISTRWSAKQSVARASSDAGRRLVGALMGDAQDAQPTHEAAHSAFPRTSCSSSIGTRPGSLDRGGTANIFPTPPPSWACNAFSSAAEKRGTGRCRDNARVRSAAQPHRAKQRARSRLDALESKYDRQFKVVFDAIDLHRALTAEKRIGRLRIADPPGRYALLTLQIRPAEMT